MYVASPDTGPEPALTRFRLPVPPQLGCNAHTILQGAEVFPWQPGAVTRSHHGEVAGATFHSQEDVEDADQATEDWPACMP